MTPAHITGRRILPVRDKIQGRIWPIRGFERRIFLRQAGISTEAVRRVLCLAQACFGKVGFGVGVLPKMAHFSHKLATLKHRLSVANLSLGEMCHHAFVNGGHGADARDGMR